MDRTLQQQFSVRFEYPLYFTRELFGTSNPVLRNFFLSQPAGVTRKLLLVLDEGMLAGHPSLPQQVRAYLDALPGFQLIDDLLVIPGGEPAKNDLSLLQRILDAVNHYGIDRHSYLVAIGGGSLLDLAGFAAAIAHRGIRHIRIPTTVLSQNDSGVGVKNGINFYGKKNFLGSFAPPVAVFNDSGFLETLSLEEYRSGMSEAVKVALIKDRSFFEWLEKEATALANRNAEAMDHLVYRCAQLHLEHIAGGDPFEMGSSRPLDFGHWSAHKLEQLSGFSVRHGEAVAMGIALDTAYSVLSGRLEEASGRRVVEVLKTLGFEITHPLMEISGDDSPLVQGLNEFREHLGGRLTIMLLEAIGKGVEVHELETRLLVQAGKWLNNQ